MTSHTAEVEVEVEGIWTTSVKLVSPGNTTIEEAVGAISDDLQSHIRRDFVYGPLDLSHFTISPPTKKNIKLEMVDGPLTVVFQPISANTGGIQGRLDQLDILKQLVGNLKKSVDDLSEQGENFNKKLSEQGKELSELRADHEELIYLIAGLTDSAHVSETTI